MRTRRVLPEITCHGCGIRFVPKYVARRPGGPRFHSARCSALWHIARVPKEEMERRREKGRAKIAGKAQARTVARWSLEARTFVQRALLDVRPDLRLADVEPLVAAVAQSVRRAYWKGYTVGYNRRQRDARRDVPQKVAA